MKPVLTLTLNPAIDQVIELDRLVVGSMNRALSSRPMTGGKGINVARVLKGFGMEVVAAGFSAGSGGNALRRTMEDEGIANCFVTVPGEVRVNLKIHDAFDGKTTEINQPGFSVDNGSLEKLRMSVDSLLGEASAMVLAGSLPGGVPTGMYGELVLSAMKRGVPVFLDADGGNLKSGLEGHPFAVKPNRDELQHFSGMPLHSLHDWVCAMRRFRRFGVQTIAATMGPEGVIMLNGEQAWHAAGLSVVPSCATGAGDSTLAAMVYGWLNGLPPERTAALMCAAGGVTAGKPGVAFCTLDEMLEAAERIAVRRIGPNLNIDPIHSLPTPL